MNLTREHMLKQLVLLIVCIFYVVFCNAYYVKVKRNIKMKIYLIRITYNTAMNALSTNIMFWQATLCNRVI